MRIWLDKEARRALRMTREELLGRFDRGTSTTAVAVEVHASPEERLYWLSLTDAELEEISAHSVECDDVCPTCHRPISPQGATET